MGEQVPEGFKQQWSRLRAADIEVVAIRDTPWLGFDVPECIEINGRTSALCSRQRDDVLARTSPLDIMPLTDGVTFLDLSGFFVRKSGVRRS
jgi:hypothetical protein